MRHENGWHYDRQALLDALCQVGIQEGDVVFSQVRLEMLGYAKGGKTCESACQTLSEAFFEILGKAGTWIVPTYSYSYCKGEMFNPEETPAAIGEFSNYFRKLPCVRRSHDPIFSVASLGPRSEELVGFIPRDCFGSDCVYDRLVKIGAKLCNVGAGFRYAPFLHYIEQHCGVPYRFLKIFPGYSICHGRKQAETWLCYVRILAENGLADLRRLESEARGRGLVKVAKVGLGEITCIDCQDMFSLACAEIKKEHWFLATGPVDDDLAESEKKRVKEWGLRVDLPHNASMMEMINAVWHLPRDLVSEGYEDALEGLAAVVPMTIHRYPSGTQCWTWIIPERWICREAYLETLGGNRIFSYGDNPLHVASYSKPFEGETSREDLFEHLLTHRHRRDAVPFHYLYYKRDWMLCCSQETKESLTDERYRVKIDSDFSYGNLCVGEVVVPGRLRNCIVFCAHLCHPAQVNDGLSGVVAGIEIMRRLSRRNDLRYTYRLLIVPETIGSAAYLSHNEELIPLMEGGLFLEMLGLKNPHALQLSYKADSPFDRFCIAAFKELDPQGWIGPFLTVVANDERQFNAPGVRVPMLSLSRVGKLGYPFSLYPEYHSNLDTPEITSPVKLRESCDLVVEIIERWEANRRPVGTFKGEPFLTRYGISYDFAKDPDRGQALFEAMFMFDGSHTVFDIAEKCDVPFQMIRQLVDEFHEKGLVEFAESS